MGIRGQILLHILGLCLLSQEPERMHAVNRALLVRNHLGLQGGSVWVERSKPIPQVTGTLGMQVWTCRLTKQSVPHEPLTQA